jgi:hypothetical protein
MSPLLLGALRCQLLPRLTSLHLTGIPGVWLPSSLPALRKLDVSCPGDSPRKVGGAVSPCQARQYPRHITALTVSCWRACSLQQICEGVSDAAVAGLQLRSLSLYGRWGTNETCVLPEAAFKGLEKLESLSINAGKVRTLLVYQLSRIGVHGSSRYCPGLRSEIAKDISKTGWKSQQKCDYAQQYVTTLMSLSLANILR